MDGWTEEWTGGRVDGVMGQWSDGLMEWIDGWIGRHARGNERQKDRMTNSLLSD